MYASLRAGSAAVGAPGGIASGAGKEADMLAGHDSKEPDKDVLGAAGTREEAAALL
jgi:hypothetical protein